MSPWCSTGDDSLWLRRDEEAEGLQSVPQARTLRAARGPRWHAKVNDRRGNSPLGSVGHQARTAEGVVCRQGPTVERRNRRLVVAGSPSHLRVSSSISRTSSVVRTGMALSATACTPLPESTRSTAVGTTVISSRPST